MYQRLCMTLLAAALLALAGTAQAQCENLRVIVRNSVYAIQGLDAFCSEFNKMKADLADMRSALSLAGRENRLLSARLADAHGVRYRPADLWSTMVREQARFYPEG